MPDVQHPRESARNTRCTGIYFLLVLLTSGLGAADLRFPSVTSDDRPVRQRLLMELLDRLPGDVKDDHFNRYLRDSGELPPVFSEMPSQFFLPDPLLWVRNGRVTNVGREDWPTRRAELAELTEEWLLGHAPPPPGNVRAEILTRTTEGTHQVWSVRLAFGPEHAATLGVTLRLPIGKAPAGIFLCDGDRYLPWAKKAMENGFGFAVHQARDGRDESLAYSDRFGEYDWSAFRRRAWSASRVVDWLVTLPEVDSGRIYIGGHSRAGKVALTAAAFDERIAGVIASSPGSGGSLPYRLCDQSYFGESAEILTRKFPDWIHPRVRLFAGSEDKLPADSHFLYALIAPRPVLMSTATEDAVESTWAVEQVYESVRPVYDLLGAGANYVQRYRPGGHAIQDESTWTAFSDFLLTASSRVRPLNEVFARSPIHTWDQLAWMVRNPIDPFQFPLVESTTPIAGGASSATAASWMVQRRAIIANIAWLTGPKSDEATSEVAVGEQAGLSKAVAIHFEKLVEVARVPTSGVQSNSDSRITTTLVRFGDGIGGCLYRPAGGLRGPLVVWLGPFQTSQGHVAPFYRVATPAPVALASAGMPVFSFDPIGTFLRQHERRVFAAAHPDAALMGKMVADARQAIGAALQALGKSRPVYLYGYAMGGTVALLTAGLDERVAGVVSVAGFTPLRSDTSDKRTGGIRRLSHLYGWLPRLGIFIGHEQRIPIDFDEIMAALAPRPLLIVAPTLDRYASPVEIEQAVARARGVYRLTGSERAIDLRTPVDENRLTDAMQKQVIDWLLQQGEPE